MKYRLCAVFLFLLLKQAQATLLPSWNEGPVKDAIVQFVKGAVEDGNPNYIPVEERIAAFDEDGTLWVEQPLYTQLFFAIDALKAQAAKHPEWKDKEPFQSILNGTGEALFQLSPHEIAQLLAIAFTGMPLEDFHQQAAMWLEKAIHPRFKRHFTNLVYQPMLELIQFLRAHQFDVYIVSGGGQEFMRAFAKKVYGIAPSHVIGTAGKVKYEYQNGQPVLIKAPEILFIDDKAGKPEGINLMIGQRPAAAFGNSTGDQQMLEWTQGGKRKSLEVLIYHDDAEREYAYGPKSKIGTFSDALMEEAKARGWIVVSMKNDWKVIFP